MLFDLMRPPSNHRGYGASVLYVDFDGVLHPDDVWRGRGRGIYLGEQAAGHQLFEGASLLISALAPYAHVRVVLSTSWVRVLGFSKTLAYLPDALKERVIGATYHSAMPKEWFSRLPRGEQVLGDVNRRQPKRWVAIDDALEGWTPESMPHFVASNSVSGLLDPTVQNALHSRLRENFCLASSPS